MKLSLLSTVVTALAGTAGVNAFVVNPTVAPVYKSTRTSSSGLLLSVSSQKQIHRASRMALTATSTETVATTATSQPGDLDLTVFNDIAALEKELEAFEDQPKEKNIIARYNRVRQKVGYVRRIIKIVEQLIAFQEALATQDPATLIKVIYQVRAMVKETTTSKKSITKEVESEDDKEDVIPMPTDEEIERATAQMKDAKIDTTTSVNTFRDTLGKLRKLAIVIFNDNMGYATYPPHPEFPDISLKNLPKMMKRKKDAPPPLEYDFSLLKLLKFIKRGLVGQYATQVAQTFRLPYATTPEERYAEWLSPPPGSWQLGSLTQILPRNERLIREWKQDKEMARQFVAGLHPLMIQVCTEPRRQLGNNLIKFFNDQNKDIKILESEKRLLFATYEELEALTMNPHSAYPEVIYGSTRDPSPADLRYFHSSKIVFELDKSRNGLDILAIELDMDLEQGGSDPQVFSRSTSTAAEWLYAKTVIQMVDSHFHEWVSHLGATHMTFEPHIIAIHNTLRGRKPGLIPLPWKQEREDHPLWDFFEPLVQDTLFLNWSARDTLASYNMNSFGDLVSSTGVGQFLQLTSKRWEKYDFFESSALPNELASRGFDPDFEFPGYLYREDGMKLWNAIGEFTQDFVDEVYKNDKQVADDDRVQEWADETTSFRKAKIPGFPQTISDKKTLALVMQTLWWIVSGLHAAVNFPQYDYLSFVPNKPLGLRKSMGQVQAESRGSEEWLFENAYPDDVATSQTIGMSYSLVLESTHTIDSLQEHYDKAQHGKKSYSKFLKKLEKIGDEIEARNQANRQAKKAVYSYLHPQVVPASIDI